MFKNKNTIHLPLSKKTHIYKLNCVFYSIIEHLNIFILFILTNKYNKLLICLHSTKYTIETSEWLLKRPQIFQKFFPNIYPIKFNILFLFLCFYLHIEVCLIALWGHCLTNKKNASFFSLKLLCLNKKNTCFS